MAVQLKTVNGPGPVDILVVAGTAGAASAATYAARMANRENKRLTECQLRSRFDDASDPATDPNLTQLVLSVANDRFRDRPGALIRSRR